MNYKRIFTCLLSFSMLIISNLESQAQQAYYVDPGVESSGNGSYDSPFVSIQTAKQFVADKNKNMTGDIIVYLRGGNYQINTPLLFKEEDSGTNGHKIIYRAYESETPLLSGGHILSGWKKVKGQIYKAEFNHNTKLRSLFVNGNRARMAGTNHYIHAKGSSGKFKINGDETWALGSGETMAGIKFSASDIKAFKNPEDVELVQQNVWTEKILCVRDITKDGKDIVVNLQQPYGAIIASMGWAGKVKDDGGFLVRNAFELLDSPGEFYFDKSSNTVYYYSRGEDMKQAKVIAPSTQGLIQVYGSSCSSRVHDIRFEGLSFSHDSWPLMKVEDSFGFGGIQSLGLAVKYIPDGNWHPSQYNSTDVPSGTIDLHNCEGIGFVRNHFKHLGSAIAINMVNDVVNSDVTGNTFYDLLGNAVNVGHPQHYKIGDGAIYTEGIEGVCKNINVTNNYIRSVSLDFRQVEGITAFFVENVKLDHNDISNTAYGAIACGWWWGNSEIPPSLVAKNNSMSFNKAGNTHLALDDGGILYLLGEQANTVVKRNYTYNGPRAIYPDDGSAYLTISENVIDNRRDQIWLHLWSPRCHDIIADNNYVKSNVTKDNGTDITISNVHIFKIRDFSGKALEIIAEAGLEIDYKDIIPEKEWATIQLYPSNH